jgi:hypothetical protein
MRGALSPGGGVVFRPPHETGGISRVRGTRKQPNPSKHCGLICEAGRAVPYAVEGRGRSQRLG